MSNYTTFFPSATGGGSTEITDPDKIPKTTVGSSSTSYIGEMFYTLVYNSTSTNDSDSFLGPFFGSNLLYRSNGGGAVSQTADNTEITLANVTNGSGYLCCIITPVGSPGATQEIKITVDGGTEKVYTYDYDSNTNIDNYYTRLIYGFSTWGSPDNLNLGNDTTASGFLGQGGSGFTWGDFTYPPLVTNTTGVSNTRLFTAHEFKNYGLPKLRFESSILVKCKTNGLYSTAGISGMGTAVYYLDSQL